eukprot:m.116615 g.116615  ORF g.116615 m.116615 type:complete len:289 (+) comp28522_c0_seq2:439-1305(+)
MSDDSVQMYESQLQLVQQNLEKNELAGKKMKEAAAKIRTQLFKMNTDTVNPYVRHGVEHTLSRMGGWGKRISFAIMINQALGKLPASKSVAVYFVSTYICVWKVIHDQQLTSAARKYVAALCGDNHAISYIREWGLKGTPPTWARFNAELCPTENFFLKAMRCGQSVVHRNLGQLQFFWGLSLFRSFVSYSITVARGKEHQGFRGLFKAMFPRGIPSFAFDCARTTSLLFTFPFLFWSFVGVAHKLKVDVSSNLIVSLIAVASVIALPCENSKRWQTCAAFVTMSIFD